MLRRSPTIPRAGHMTIERFRALYEAGMADFEHADRKTNERAARCRVCGASCPPGEAVGYDEFMSDGYRASQRYVCRPCAEATKSVGGAANG